MPEGAGQGLVDRGAVFDQALQRVLAKMAEAGYPMQVTSRKRTAEQQRKLFEQGRATTHLDGTTKVSHHQVGTGADLAFVVGGKPSWDAKLPWSTLGRIAKAEGLTWGGDWKDPFDPGHIQLGGNLPGTAIGERVMPRGVQARGTFTQTPAAATPPPAAPVAQTPVQGPPVAPGGAPAEDDEIIVAPTAVAPAPVVAPAAGVPGGYQPGTHPYARIGNYLKDTAGAILANPANAMETLANRFVASPVVAGLTAAKPLVDSRESLRKTAGVVLPAATSIVGGAVGGAYGGPRGALGGAVALAPVGEAAAMGVETLTGAPPSIEDVASRMGWSGGTALAGEGIARGLIAVGRPFAKKVTDAGRAAIKRLEGVVTPAQATDSRALDIAENIVSGSMLGGGARTALLEDQEQRLKAIAREEIDRFAGGPVTREAAGRSVQTALQSHPGVQPPPMAPSTIAMQGAATHATAQATAADQAAQQHVLNVLGKLGRTEPKPAGAKALSARQREVEAFRAGERDLYGDFERKAGGVLVEEAPELDAFAQQLLGREKGNIAPGMGLRAARRVAQLFARDEESDLAAMSAGGVPITSLGAAAKQAVLDALGDAGKETAEPLTAVEFQKTVSSLGRVVRQLTRAAQTDPSKNADLGMAKRLLGMAKADMENLLRREAPEAFEALTRATGFSREGNARLFNDTVRKMAREAPERILGTLLRKDNSTAVDLVRRAIGEGDFKALESAAVNRILRPNVRTGRVEWQQVLSRIDQLGDDTVGAFTPGGEIQGLRDVARMALGYGQAAKAAQAAAKGAGKSAAPSPQIRYLRKLVQADPDAVVDLIVQSKRPIPVRLVRDAVPDTVWRNVQARVTEDLLEDLSGKHLAARITAMGKDTMRELYPAGEDQGLQELSRILTQLQTTKEGTGKMWIQLSQAGAAATVLSGGVFFGEPKKGAAGAATILLGPKVLAKIMMSKTGRKWLTTGLTSSPGSQMAIRAASHLAAFAGIRPVAESLYENFNRGPGAEPPPDNPFQGFGAQPPPENPWKRQ